MAASNGSEYFEFEIEAGNESFSRPSNAESVAEDEEELLWAAIARLPSQKRSNFALLRKTPSERGRTEAIDVSKLDRHGRELLVKKALATTDQDNYKLLSAIKERLDRFFYIYTCINIRKHYVYPSTKNEAQSSFLFILYFLFCTFYQIHI